MATPPADPHDDLAAVDQRAAFERLFAMSFAPIYRHVYSRGASENQAREITFQVFLRLWTRGTALDFNRPLNPILGLVAKLIMIDALPQARTSSCSFGSGSGAPPFCDELRVELNDAEHEFIRLELVECALRMAEGLPSEQREVMALRWRNQLSHAEIAKRLNISAATVRRHLEQAGEQVWEPLFAKLAGEE